MKKLTDKELAITTLLSLTLLCSCKGINNPDVIHLDGTFDDNFLESWEYIILEDGNIESELGGLNQEIRYDDGLFFIHSEMYENTTIKVFDRSGHYLNNIGHMGRARNEYTSLEAWTLDTYNNEVIVAVGSGYGGAVTLKHFDYNGNFIGQTETDTLGGNCILSTIAKCTSDGSLLIQDNILHSSPTHAYYNIHKDGNVCAPMELAEYQMKEKISNTDISLFFQTGILEPDMEAGLSITTGFFNPYSDTTYVIRKLDNNIYRIYGDKCESVAKLSFVPDTPEKMKKGIEFDNEDIYSYSIGYFLDMKDYIFMGYDGGGYLFEKATSKIYHMSPDTINSKIPSHRIPSVCGNDIIAWVDDFLIKEALECIDSKDYDHRYSPEVEAFYRKVKDCENPPIIIAHYRKKQ